MSWVVRGHLGHVKFCISDSVDRMISYATLTLWRIFLRYEYLNFAVNSPKNCDLDSEYFHLGHPSVVWKV